MVRVDVTMVIKINHLFTAESFNERVCVCVHLNYGEYADQRGALVFIHRGRGNKTEAFEELVGVSAGRDTWGV